MSTDKDQKVVIDAVDTIRVRWNCDAHPLPGLVAECAKRFPEATIRMHGDLIIVEEPVMNPVVGAGREVDLYIRHKATGVTVKAIRWTFPTGDDVDPTFDLERGNYACDCNRAREFDRARGIDPDDDEPDDKYPCGEGAYTVRVTAKDDPSDVLYDEWETKEGESTFMSK
jgi:hypothetical protein